MGENLPVTFGARKGTILRGALTIRRIFRLKKHMSKRLPILLNLLEANPSDAFALFAAAKEYEGMNDAVQALHYYEKLRATDPAYVGLYYHLGKLYERLNNPDGALDAYRQGCAAARQAGDQHAFNELMGARLNLDHPHDDEI